jgi:hypothetical protein
MFAFKSIVLRSMVLGLTLPFAITSAADAQDSTESEPVRIDHARLPHHFEAGLNVLGAGLEYRYQWFSFFSTDAVASLETPGVAAGLTFSPMWIFYVQGVVGTGAYREEAVVLDGPPAFKPAYFYGWDAGFHIPLMPTKTRLYFIFAFGQLKYVQPHYNYNGGGFIVGPPPTPLYRTETRTRDIFSIGLGMSL